MANMVCLLNVSMGYMQRSNKKHKYVIQNNDENIKSHTNWIQCPNTSLNLKKFGTKTNSNENQCNLFNHNLFGGEWKDVEHPFLCGILFVVRARILCYHSRTFCIRNVFYYFIGQKDWCVHRKRTAKYVMAVISSDMVCK